MRGTVIIACWLGAAALLAGCTTSKFLIETARALQERSSGTADPTAGGGQASQPAEGAPVLQVQQGDAAWYGDAVAGNLTASGQIFDPRALTAAHNSFPFESMVRVTNLRNGRQVIVRITDRGAFHEPRVIDVSERAAELLGFKSAGVAPVRLELLSNGRGMAAR